MSRVAVVGTGMIGASIAMALRARTETEVVGYDADPEALSAAPVSAAASVSEAARGADVVFVCVPVDVVAEVAEEALDAGAAAVTDVASVKAPIVEALAGRDRFVGGHPMTGSERSGPQAASASLFEGAAWILTPAEGTDPAVVQAVGDVVAAIGARRLRMDADGHDRVVAVTSHLPQVAAWALARTAAEADEPAVADLIAGGFYDTTRLAGSDPELWAGILQANAGAVGTAIEALTRRLEGLAALLRAGDRAALAAELARARRDRERLTR